MTVNEHRVITESRNPPYVPRPVRLDLFSPALRQAVMAAEPLFFSWGLEAQDRFRRDPPEDFSDSVRAHLERAIEKQHGVAWGQGDFKEPYAAYLTALNTLKQPWYGIGDDCLWITEWNDDWYDAHTIEDLSRDHYASDPERPENKLPFMGQFFPIWCRYLDGGRLVYATLTAFHHEVADSVENALGDKIDELIPHEYIEGPDHGKPAENGGYQWDFRVHAAGCEGQLEELQSRSRRIAIDMHLRALEDAHHRQSGCIYRQVRSDGDEPMVIWIFDGLMAMQGVRLEHLLSDIKSRRGNTRRLQAMIQPYVAEALVRIQDEYDDIMANWNPKISKLKKRRKIIIAKGALDNLFD